MKLTFVSGIHQAPDGCLLLIVGILTSQEPLNRIVLGS